MAGVNPPRTLNLRAICPVSESCFFALDEFGLPWRVNLDADGTCQWGAIETPRREDVYASPEPARQSATGPKIPLDGHLGAMLREVNEAMKSPGTAPSEG